MRPLALSTVALVLGAGLLGGCATNPVRRTIRASTNQGTATFVPSIVKVRKGEKVVFRVTNATDRQHGFSIDGYGVATTVDPDKPIRVQLTARQAGRFRIFPLTATGPPRGRAARDGTDGRRSRRTTHHDPRPG